MNKDKRNNIQLLGTLNNADESGIIANANQIYDANEDKSTQDVSKEHKERIETLETKESSMQTTLENISKTGEASAASNVTYNHSDSKLDATNVQQAVDEVRKRSNYNDGDSIIDFNTIHIITDNPEFAIAAVDVNDRILYGIKADGQPYWGVGVPKVVRDYVDKQVNDILGTDNITETIDSLKEVEKFLSDFKNSDTLKALLDTKANKVDVVFDISAYHATGGTLATYDNLEDALGTNGKNIPQSLRKGGMSVKFVQSSDNKYVHFNYLLEDANTNSKFTNVNNWQGVDVVPMLNSKNLVESGGVFKSLLPIKEKIKIPLVFNLNSIGTEGTYSYNSNRVIVEDFIQGTIIGVKIIGTSSGVLDSSKFYLIAGSEWITMNPQYTKNGITYFSPLPSNYDRLGIRIKQTGYDETFNVSYYVNDQNSYDTLIDKSFLDLTTALSQKNIFSKQGYVKYDGVALAGNSNWSYTPMIDINVLFSFDEVGIIIFKGRAIRHPKTGGGYVSPSILFYDNEKQLIGYIDRDVTSASNNVSVNEITESLFAGKDFDDIKYVVFNTYTGGEYTPLVFNNLSGCFAHSKEDEGSVFTEDERFDSVIKEIYFLRKPDYDLYFKYIYLDVNGLLRVALYNNNGEQIFYGQGDVIENNVHIISNSTKTIMFAIILKQNIISISTSFTKDALLLENCYTFNEHNAGIYDYLYESNVNVSAFERKYKGYILDTSNPLCNSNASAATINQAKTIRNNAYECKTYFGQQYQLLHGILPDGNLWGDSKENPYYAKYINGNWQEKSLEDIVIKDSIYDCYGIRTKIVGFDIYDYINNRYLNAEGWQFYKYQLTGAIKKYHSIVNDGIIAISAHVGNPYDPNLRGSSYNYNDSTYPNVMYQIINEEDGGIARAWFDNYKTYLIDLFNSLTDENGNSIPVIFRPFHEASAKSIQYNLNSFWWNQSSNEEYIKVFRELVEAVNAECDNVIWCFNGYIEKYPGNNWSDIVSIDYYMNDVSNDSVTSANCIGYTPDEVYYLIKKHYEFAEENNKIFTLFETGNKLATRHDFYNNDFLEVIRNENLAIPFCITWDNRRTDYFYVPYDPTTDAGKDFKKFLERNSIN